jgi:hypothetical protein
MESSTTLLVFYFLLTLYCQQFWNVNSVKYQPCTPKPHQENRRLYVATCDTRSGWKEFMALKVWNTSSYVLQKKGLNMRNVCTGKNWGRHGYLTKPLIYLDFVSKLSGTSTAKSPAYVILMDSDTFWSVDDISKIWNKFDCARGQKEVVLSTEMSCWVGRYCTKEDLQRWYSRPQDTPSYSPFANSGIIMGRVDKVQKMLSYVVTHNKSYYIKYTKLKFDDQYAIADYSINVAPEDVALDYHQQVSATFSIHTPNNPPDEPGWPFVCKNKTGLLDTSCPNWTMKVMRMGHFRVNKTNCLLGRHTNAHMWAREELETLAPDPLIWHGNGAGKRLYGQYGHETFKCNIAQRNMTEDDHQKTCC